MWGKLNSERCLIKPLKYFRVERTPQLREIYHKKTLLWLGLVQECFCTFLYWSMFCFFFLDLSHSSDTERMLPCWQSHERFSFRHTYVRETMFCHAEKMGKAPLFLAAQCTLVLRGTDNPRKKLLSKLLIIQKKMQINWKFEIMRKQPIGCWWF